MSARRQTKAPRRAQWGVVTIVFAALVLFGCGTASSGGGGGGGGGGGTAEVPQVDPKALEWFEQGVKIAASNPTKAAQLFADAVNEDESFGEAWYNLGVLQEQGGDLEAAVESYTNAVETRPALSDAYVNLAAIHLERYDGLARSLDWDAADSELETARQHLLKVVDDETGIDTFHVEANLNLGMIYRLEGERIVKKSNEGIDMMARMDEGTVDRRNFEVPEPAKEKFAEAVRHVRKALAGDSNNIVSYENLAAIYYDLNSLEVATLVSEQALQKHTDRNGELAELLAEGKITQAEHDAKVISETDMARVHNTYGLIWLARGEVALAYNEFKTAMAMKPDFTEARFNVAGVAVNVQDYTTAYTIYTQLVQEQPDNRDARLSKAVAARGLGQLDEAEKIYNEMLTADPDYAPAKFNLGILYHEYHRDLETAKKIYEEFMAMPGATKWAPERIEDAQTRIDQIVAIWAAQKDAEAEQRRIQAEVKKMQQEMGDFNGDGIPDAEQDLNGNGVPDGEEGGAPTDGAPADGGGAPVDGADGGGAPADGGDPPADG